MTGFVWGPSEEARLAAIRDDLAGVSTATACQLLIAQGWRNSYLRGLLPLKALGLGNRLVGRARTCRYLMRRGPEGPHDPAARRVSPEIVLIESLEPGDILCVDALGCRRPASSATSSPPGSWARGAAGGDLHGAVRDSPFIKQVGLPVFTRDDPPLTQRSRSGPGRLRPPGRHGRRPGPARRRHPGRRRGRHGDAARPGRVHRRRTARRKNTLEEWIRGKVAAGGSIHDYYPPERGESGRVHAETGRTAPHGPGKSPSPVEEDGGRG